MHCVAGPLKRWCARSTSVKSTMSAGRYFCGKRPRRNGLVSTFPVFTYFRTSRVTCAKLRPVTLLKYARIAPRCFRACAVYCCCTSIRSVQSYPSVRLWPVNSMPPLALKNSLICSAVRLSAFCICTCTQPLHAYPTSSSFRIILYWNQARFQDHLVLDNSVDERKRRAVLLYKVSTYLCTRVFRGPTGRPRLPEKVGCIAR